MKFNKSLLIVMRRESLSDFEAIARRARKIDPSIWIHLCPDGVDPEKIPPGFLNLPLLSIYLVNPPPDSFKPTAGQLAVKGITKLEEYEHFKKHNIPCLPIEAFHWGMTLDKSVYGDWVVLKPQTIQSTGKDVNMVPTDLIPTLKLENFPEDHLIRQDQYYVQKFVKTGERPAHYRVLVFLNTVLYIRKNESVFEYPNLNHDLKARLSQTVASNYPGYRKHLMVNNDEISQFALKVSKSFIHLPLLGIDVIQETSDGNLYTLEINAGGNTWHFSSNFTALMGEDNRLRREQCLKQFNAFDRAAEALVSSTHRLAF